MLVLSRKVDEVIHIGRDIVIRVLSIHGHKVRLGIEAPDSVFVVRDELTRRAHGETAPAGLTRTRKGGAAVGRPFRDTLPRRRQAAAAAAEPGGTEAGGTPLV